MAPREQPSISLSGDMDPKVRDGMFALSQGPCHFTSVIRLSLCDRIRFRIAISLLVALFSKK